MSQFHTVPAAAATVVESRSAHGAQVEVAGAPPTAETTSQPAHAGTTTSRRAIVPVFGHRSHTEPMSPDLVAGRHRPSRRATKQFALQARVERAQDNADRHVTTQGKSVKGKSRVASVVKVKAGVVPSAQVPVVKVTSGASDHDVEVKDRASRGRHYSRRELARRSHRQMVLADQLGFFAYAAPELVDPSVTVQPLEFVAFDAVETVVAKQSPRLPKRVARQLQRQAGVLRFAGVVQA
jgi:hypothetical protein